MKNDYKPIKPMKEIPDQLRKLRRQFLRYQQAEIVYSLGIKQYQYPKQKHVQQIFDGFVMHMLF